MRISEVKRQSRLAEWGQHIQDQQASGLTVKAWCAAHGCSEGRYYYWLRIVRSAAIERVERSTQCAALVKVDPARLPSSTPSMPTLAASGQTGIIIRCGQATVAFSAGTAIAAIAELLKALNA